MRVDDLILTEDEYPHGACDNKQEWLLMYSRGVPPAVIATWRKADVRRVHRAIQNCRNHTIGAASRLFVSPPGCSRDNDLMVSSQCASLLQRAHYPFHLPDV